MSLPAINVPEYTIKLPLSEKNVSFRPFVVGEEKLLLIAVESQNKDEIYSTIRQIVKQCTSEKIDIELLPGTDLEYLFLNLRAKSVGETVEPICKCPKCQYDFSLKINLNDVKVNTRKKPERKIMLTDKIGVTLNFPSLQIAKKFSSKFENNQQIQTFHVIELIADCIENIFTESEVHSAKDYTTKDLAAWLEQLPEHHFKPIVKFFEDLPKLIFEQTITCPNCQENVELKLEGIDDFFT